MGKHWVKHDRQHKRNRAASSSQIWSRSRTLSLARVRISFGSNLAGPQTLRAPVASAGCWRHGMATQRTVRRRIKPRALYQQCMSMYTQYRAVATALWMYIAEHERGHPRNTGTMQPQVWGCIWRRRHRHAASDWKQALAR